ncbi:FKBP-type peptidyl-prolyl cis-trans isomerase [Lysobacter enzymogenes]|uniref:FKBP-type peptidyl-prolyl cis-trans isomerase n=1 Tax=Lysobacter enzymogenes TaxID=69 RepID=UPI001A970A8F|nr:FKBP-type peptidyl-prolyl cis-trans isomerase [Lysobacter enzymogenes]QQP97322.1 FKBP-type peptidyl-prolyl cis-trans isomerase [Lysobacter enzymogenes]
MRNTALAIAVASMALFAAGCDQTGKPAGDKAAESKSGDKAADAKKDVKVLGGMKTEKEQNSYLIGMDMGRSLELLKDDIDLAVLQKAMQASMKGEKSSLSDEEAMQIRQRLQETVRNKQVEKMLATAKKNQEEGEKFLAANGKKAGVVTTASGLQYQIVSEGKGAKPKASDTVRVHYKGTLLDGKEFDSSYARNEPAVFPLGAVVPGWQEGIALMPVGSKFKLWIPAKLGYGEQGTPGGPIGPNATLVFDVELLDIVKADGPESAAMGTAPKH